MNKKQKKSKRRYVKAVVELLKEGRRLDRIEKEKERWKVYRKAKEDLIEYYKGSFKCHFKDGTTEIMRLPDPAIPVVEVRKARLDFTGGYMDAGDLDAGARSFVTILLKRVEMQEGEMKWFEYQEV